jgi:hypothetical protein
MNQGRLRLQYPAFNVEIYREIVSKKPPNVPQRCFVLRAAEKTPG